MAKDISIAYHFAIYFIIRVPIYDSEMLFLRNNLNNWKLQYRWGSLDGT